MSLFKYALFFDVHTMASIPDVGVKFDAEAFTDQVLSCGVDYLTLHARCNRGNAYYNTKIGMRHPSLQFDLIGQLANACHRKGIKFTVYFNGHLSEEEILAHPEWEDRPLKPRNYKESPFYRQICYNSTFGDHLIAMSKELIENYPIDGFFYDCLGPSDCVCPTCAAEMLKRGMDPTNDYDVRVFSNESSHRMCVHIHDELVKIKPDLFFFFNGRPFEEIHTYESHLEAECIPTGSWGYDCLPRLAHFLRTLEGPDKCVLNMTGRFTTWGDFGSLRTAEGLEYDLFYGIANGMRPDIGDHLHPRGDWPQAICNRVKEVYDKLRPYDEWSLDAVNRPEVALVQDRLSPLQYYPYSDSLSAAVRMLTEQKVQFDVVSTASSWDQYKLLIFADCVTFTPEIAERVKRHLAKGGKVLATGNSGLNPAGNAFALADEWPVTYGGPSKHDPLYFQPEGRFAAGLPAIPLMQYASGAETVAKEGSTIEMYCVKPYLNSGFDGLHSNCYLPPDAKTSEPYVATRGNIIYVSGELFKGYFNQAIKEYRVLLGNLLNELDPAPLLKTANMYSFSRAFVQFKDKYRMVHLLSYCPERRLNANAVEDRPVMLDAQLALRLDGRAVSKVYLAPDRKPLPFTIKDGYCHVTVPRCDGYALVVFE